MAKQKNEQQPLGGDSNGGSAGTALATRSRDELAELAEQGIEFEDDGLGELDGGDYKVAALVLNSKAMDERGRAIPPDVFYNTVDETTTEKVDGVLLHLHKTNLFSEFDNVKNEQVTRCRSFDRVVGEMADGTKRPCEGCPDAQWRTTPEGKRTRNCGDVYNMFGVDRATGMPFVYRAKKTSLPIIKQHLQKHHIGRRMVQVKDAETGKIVMRRANYPLFAFAVEIKAKMMQNGGTTWAVPVITRGALLSADEMAEHSASQQFLAKNLAGMFGDIEKRAEQADGGGDTSFDTASYGKPDEKGQDFNDAPSSAA